VFLALAAAVSGCAMAGPHAAPPASAPAPAVPVRAAAANPAPPVPPEERAAPAARPVPVLMYHEVGVAPPHAPLWQLYVAPDLFAAQVEALRKAGYTAVTLQQAYDAWHGLATLPPHPVVFTFDDGYAGVFAHAVPTLAALGWPAVLNLQVGRLDVPGGLTREQVRQMIADGWEVDDHTITHPDLTTLSPLRLRQEVVGAAEAIRSQFGVPVRFFCYPAGRYNPAVVAAVHAAGFLGATTTWPGYADPTTEGYWTLDRIRVSGGEAPAALLASLRWYGNHAPSPPPPSFPPPSGGKTPPPAGQKA
jgi:peptidoglycan/xylan/chitin deacetylase (PgdA/CDA1 family)